MAPIVLIHSPLVGPSSLRPTAEVLTNRGYTVCVPTPSPPAAETPWHAWPQSLLDVLPDLKNPILVGHSAGGLIAARLASALNASAFICLDAMMPPEGGPVPPVEQEFLTFVQSLPIQDGLLPVWTDWWEGEVLGAATIAPELKRTFLAEQPRLSPDWFADSFDMPDWSASPRGYLQTSPVFADEAQRAKALGWPVVSLTGTHLHPMLAPGETATALIDICRDLGAF